ncbi:sigma-54-dependent transcriptional regulator [Pseudoalteromonas umbrosa]|uniref:sigma-54-dependent transcriptional regulator n=1 Tax=Pseudoalteromonas umbrosa TaxID=3048489 RepID=UPI0024C38CD6|nr:sigma-54 dependent transcriptional regulator [Pseudoalteromonas sp. B95]MDK1288438.1 sigma-54 dependent transcriptional regulator [Pseudoalteromonas sp. B95]
MVADDDDDIRLALSLLLSSESYKVIEASTPKDVIIKASQQKPDIILLDMNFSRDTTCGQEGLDTLQQLKQSAIPVILMTAWGTIDLAVKALQEGACDFIEKPWNNFKLLNSIKQQLCFSKIKQENQCYHQLFTNDVSDNWVCQSSSMLAIEQLIKQIAPTDANVLILGENGTGKSLLAERIHQLSHRQRSPFIAVNMAAIPESLFESELFGHQKGAFTDARQNRVGRFQLAEKGTLFLDEVGTLPLPLQPKLLRVLETGSYEVLGASQTQTADVRIISATNADLSKLVSSGEFRQDLLYRLNTLVINLPPLRERLDDIEALAISLIQRFSLKYNKHCVSLTKGAIKKLRQHTWPGNIRELSHVIERAILLTTEPKIDADQLLLESTETPTNNVILQPLEMAEKQLIVKAMEVSSGQVLEAAKLLEISRNALYRRLEKFCIQYES